MKEVYKDGGLFHGNHTGASSSTVLKAQWKDFLIGGAASRRIKNVSDGSSGIARSPTLMDGQGYSTLTATLTGGTRNKWLNGATFTLYIGTTASARLTSTCVGRGSGLQYPRDQLIEGEIPEFLDIDQQTMTTHKKRY